MKRALILSASAGSGKTFRLVLKYICDIIMRPDRYRNILAVTFTNKATEEMKSRIINEIHRLASNSPSQYLEEIIKATQLSEPQIRERALKARTKILHDYSRFTVLTIDRFFQRILRAFINELSLDLNYNIELDTSLLLERSVDSLIESITEEPEIKNWLLEFAEERLNDGSMWDMRRDMRSLGEELFKGDVAKRIGTNISKSDLHNIIKRMVKDNNDVLQRIKTLGTEALEEMAKYGVEAKEFKGKSKSFATKFKTYADGEFVAPTASFIKASTDINEWYGKDASANIKAVAEALYPKLCEICRLYEENIEKINTTKLLRENYRNFALLADLYGKINKICDEENIMVLDKTKEILSEFVDQSNAPFIYEKVGNRYDHYMIDEFQDTSVREWRNLRPLLLEALASNPEASVFIVGDIKQSIYRWRGGDWRLLNGGVVNDLGHDNTQVEPLKFNYRSLKNIVDFNRILIDKVVDRDNAILNTLLDNALDDSRISEVSYESLYDIVKRAYADNDSEARIKSDEQGIAEVCLFDTDISKESPFIEAIEDAISRGYRYRDILILVRGKKDGRRVAEALYAYKNRRFTQNGETGFNILTSDSLTIDSCDIVTFIIATLRLAINPADDIERGIFNGYLNRPYHTTFSEEELATLRHIAHLSPIEAFEVIVERFELNKHSAHLAYIQAMHEQIMAFTSTHIADIQHYLEWWEERGCNETLSVEMTDDTIEITTIHKAKGLERDVVIIPYCTWSMTPQANLRPIVWAKTDNVGDDMANIGDFPVVYGKTMENSAFSEDYCNELVMSHVDSVNLLYVAITRAAKELYIYIPKRLNTTSKSGDNISDITSFVIDAVSTMCEASEERNETGDRTIVRYTYGKRLEHPKLKQHNTTTESIILQDYPTSKPNIAIHYPTHRYSEEGLTPGSTSCRNGIMLHRIFEKASTVEELYSAIKRMSLDCLIDNDEADRLRSNIERAMSDERAREWFCGSWDDIKTEAEILCKKGIRRPDRVMISGDRAVVVDYKFGDKINKYYNRQMSEYISLLRSMGKYNTIEGYVWYISLGHIESVVQ